MKFVLKIGASLILLWLVFFLVYRVTLMWNPLAIQKKTSAFLDAYIRPYCSSSKSYLYKVKRLYHAYIEF